MIVFSEIYFDDYIEGANNDELLTQGVQGQKQERMEVIEARSDSNSVALHFCLFFSYPFPTLQLLSHIFLYTIYNGKRVITLILILVSK